MWWTNPFWLLALILIVPVLWLGGFTLSSKKQSGQSQVFGKVVMTGPHALKRLTILRAAAVMAAVLGLAGTSILIPTKNRHTVMIFDVSASIGIVQVEDSRRAALQIIRGLSSYDSVALVSFAGKPAILTPSVKPEDAVVILESAIFSPELPQQTDLQAALRVGVELLQAKQGNRSILLFSDGHSNSGGPVSEVLKVINGLGISIHSIPAGLPGNDLTTLGLNTPDMVHPGERIPVQWKMTTNGPQSIIRVITLDGKESQRITTRMNKGESSFHFEIPPLQPGVHTVEVEAMTTDGKKIPSSMGGALLWVSGRPKVLAIQGDSSPALSRALEIQGIQVDKQEVSGLPETANGFDSYAAVILDNIPALDITENQQNLLQNYVSAGGGLLVIGGDSSLGRGEYYATGLEELLPVQTDTRQRLFFPRVNILFVIDTSGSMSEMVGNTSKQLAAMQGVAAAIAELNPQDEVGILSFDVQPTWVLHFTSASNRAQIAQSLSGIGEGGGTDMSAAIQEVIREFSSPGPIRRHVIILTDGITGGGNFRELSLKLSDLRVTVTTIGVGENVDEQLLRDIAQWGDGQFYRANLDQIPQVIQKETIRISRDLIQEGDFKPVLRTPLMDAGGFDNNLPRLKGYLITKPKALATIYQRVGKEDPLLAGWRYGNGRVMVFTSDSGRRWLAPWSGSRIYNLFWSQVVRSVQRNDNDEGLQVFVRTEAATAQITVEAIGPDHRLKTGLQLVGYTSDNPVQSFPLKESAPGRYEANVQINGSGIQQFKVYDRQSESWGIGWAWIPPGTELSKLGPDNAFLGQLSSSTGGKLMSVQTAELPSLQWKWAPLNLQNWLIIVALSLFIVELGYRSTLLGQFSTARAILANWWAVQVRLAETIKGVRTSEELVTIRPEQTQTMEAYRFLAEKARRHREEQKDAQKRSDD